MLYCIRGDTALVSTDTSCQGPPRLQNTVEKQNMILTDETPKYIHALENLNSLGASLETIHRSLD